MILYDFCGTLVNKITTPDFVEFVLKKKPLRYIIYKFLSNRYIKLLEPHYFLFLLNRAYIEKMTEDYSVYLKFHINNLVLESFTAEKNKFIISAGFEDIISAFLKSININNFELISNKFDYRFNLFIPKKRVVTGATKINFIKKDPEILYTDSLDDINLILVSKKCFYISNELPNILKKNKNVILLNKTS
jgi:hypothetical protein